MTRIEYISIFEADVSIGDVFACAPFSIVNDNMFPLALMGVLALGGLCTIDPSPRPPSPLQEIFKYGGFRNSCSIFVLV